MKILVTGSTGFIGSALISFLSDEGHKIVSYRHSEPLSPERWGSIDAVIHLAGENIASGRWTKGKKKRIRGSRIEGTRQLIDRLIRQNRPPPVFLSASAVGYYGDRGEELLTEKSIGGWGFLAEVCSEWEKGCEPLRLKGTRVVNLRFGMVLSPAGGALQKMLLSFRMGLGGVIGSGRQHMSWITLDDCVRAIDFSLRTNSLQGPINVVTPHPVTNRIFTKTLGEVLSRPTLFPMPAFLVRLVFGEMANELLLASARVEPVRLLEAGFKYHHPELEGALRDLILPESPRPPPALFSVD